MRLRGGVGVVAVTRLQLDEAIYVDRDTRELRICGVLGS
jgi:hypothetical protein